MYDKLNLKPHEDSAFSICESRTMFSMVCKSHKQPSSSNDTVALVCNLDFVVFLSFTYLNDTPFRGNHYYFLTSALNLRPCVSDCCPRSRSHGHFLFLRTRK